MAADKLIDSAKEAACRTAEANAIRAKTGSNAAINYDFANNKGFADAIAAIPTGGGVTTEALNVTQNGVYTAPSGTAYTPVTVNVQSGVTYKVSPETETWEHNQWVTLGLDIAEDGGLTVYKESGGGTVQNPRICYPQSNTYDSSSIITAIDFPQEAGDYELPVSVWWDNGGTVASDHSNHTITYTVVSEGTEPITAEPITITQNGVYTAPAGKAYTPVTVNVEGSSEKNVQYSGSLSKISNNGTYTRAGGSITVKKSGTYTCRWIAFANTTGSTTTYASCLYRGTSAVSGSAKAAAAYNGSVTSIAVSVSGVQLDEGQTIEVRAKSRTGSSNYFTVAGHLIIEEE